MRTSNQAVLWAMLGVMPHQEELEAMSAAWDSEASSQLLGNRYCSRKVQKLVNLTRRGCLRPR